MAAKSDPPPGVNSWLEDELYQQYLHDRRTVDDTWKEVFERDRPPNGGSAQAEPRATAPVRIAETAGEELVPLRGAAARIAQNMDASVSVPIATSQRVVPVKVIDENRRIINQQRTLQGRTKVSYTHLVGWAVVQSLKKYPSLNHAFAASDGELFRVARKSINIGIAIDVAGKDGVRSLLVPNIKDAGAMDFQQYLNAFDDVVARARANRLTPADFQGTSISLTNPGTVGTMSSIPRLMPGQGAIIAVGAIDYPPEYQGVSAETRAMLGISKVMSISCTYDHRIIQGAESGMFLGRLQELLEGRDDFYEEVFEHLKMPYHPVGWAADQQAHAQTTPPIFAQRDGEAVKAAAVIQLINAYRVRGHLIADLDPLGGEPNYHPELDPATYGLTIWDLDREFLTGTLGEAIGESAPKPLATLREILETLRQTYCGKIGCEYMNIQQPEQKRWLQHRMEPEANSWELDRDNRVRILQHLFEAEEFEHFLHTRFVGHKRFSLEGAETAIAILDELIERAAANDVHELVIGMAHRGRLNVLANIVGKSLTQVFSEFEGNIDPASMHGSGDVKYHLGATNVRATAAGPDIVVSVAPNPSHLEAVSPVVEGIVRPKQDRLGDTERRRVIPILVHGDAAFAGQGVVGETLNLSQLDGYWTGGTVHLIINNQIGFTTMPDEARSTPYSTDVARMVQAPIFHVNGDDPEAAVRVVQIAFDYRQQFKKDVVIDMICYRRHGHNEVDDPSYTQPLLYRKIRNHPSVAKLYAARLVREDVLEEPEVERMRKRIAARFNEAYDAAQENAEQFEVQELSAVPTEAIEAFCPRTGIDRETLDAVGQGVTSFPADFHLHPKLRGFVERRKEAIRKGGPIDWAFAETLAFGSLVVEGVPIRLSGQDSTRGTFSQRHLGYYDSEDGREYVPLKQISPDQARFDVYDSSLSEYAVLGFEFGYSVADPLTLVLWEAQFGDFANGAQIMIDQFITCAEAKWGQPSGIVLLLPHGYEGQGPEHSSARIERFLTLCAEQNMQVVNCTTPAQYFHVLRRQMYGGPDRRGMRKPLVIFTPKYLLRHPAAVSTTQDLMSGSFREVLAESDSLDPQRVSRVIFCSGKVYYDLLAARAERKASHAALIRLEQLYPFPHGPAQDALMRYPVTSEVLWVQEEPRNMGAWRFVREQIQPMLDPSRRTLRYVGRAESSSPATGSMARHQQEQAHILDESLTTEPAAAAGKVRLVSRRRK
ncbi:MAG: multifunctional oxoglutarate decarboxylase/oxoglutarate dehydrogenase thiamine pyrophosphate-binding subunit/dihydrolipoyllysine-residue succinyltransferase subunit [Bryobacteraceae bacterium]